MHRVSCLILAGGKGSRLFPLTEKRAKPAVRFGGNYRLIDIPISNALNCGVKDLFVYTQYEPEELEAHIRESFPNKRIFPANIQIMSPPLDSQGIEYFRGTADAIRKTAAQIEELDTDYILILSGDQLYTMDLHEMLESAINKQAELVIATLLVQKENAKRFGIMKINESKQIIDFVEKPQDESILEKFSLASGGNQYLASMGIYLFKKKTLLNLLKEEGDDFGKDLIPKQVRKESVYAYVYQGYWEDIGTIPSYYEANLALLKQENCLDTTDTKFPILSTLHDLPNAVIRGSVVHNALIAHGSRVEAKIIRESIIGLNTHIQEGSVIEDSIILGGHPQNPVGSVIGQNCHICKTIIDENCHIGNNVKLTNKQGLKHFDGDGIFIRDGIMIVASGTIIPDGFEL